MYVYRLLLWSNHRSNGVLCTRSTLTCVPELTFADVLGEHGGVALQLGDDPQVKVNVISASADAPAEVHLHAAHVSPTCASFPRYVGVMT